jgi:P27 family predicted phage terminase small subunit
MVMGRPRKPTRIKVVEGTARDDRMNFREPMPKRGIPNCPSFLSKAAKKKWKEIVPELDRLGVITLIDGDALACYCEAWGEFEATTKIIAKNGRFTSNAAGTRISHPAVAQQRSAWEAIKKFSCMYGLDPSSRSKIQAAPVDNADPFEQFLENKGETG